MNESNNGSVAGTHSVDGVDIDRTEKTTSKKYIAYQQWEQNVWNPTGPHPETSNTVNTQWGYKGSSQKLKAFKQYYRANNGKILVTPLEADGKVNADAGISSAEELKRYEQWEHNVWQPTGPHSETKDMVQTQWGYRGSGSRLREYQLYLKNHHGIVPNKPLNGATAIDIHPDALDHEETYELYQRWYAEECASSALNPECKDLRTTDWGYIGSDSHLEAFYAYAKQQGYVIIEARYH